MSESYLLPFVGIEAWPPDDDALPVWTYHYGRRLRMDPMDADRLREAVQWEQRDAHPYVRDFHLKAVELAIAQAPGPKRWQDVEQWNEDDFREHVRMDQEDGRKGSYRSLAERIEGWTATPLLRRWQKVSGDKPWPSGRRNRTTRDTH